MRLRLGKGSKGFAVSGLWVRDLGVQVRGYGFRHWGVHFLLGVGGSFDIDPGTPSTLNPKPTLDPKPLKPYSLHPKA